MKTNTKIETKFEIQIEGKIKIIQTDKADQMKVKTQDSNVNSMKRD